MQDEGSRSERYFDAATLKANTLIRAAQILGGIERLSAYLSVPQSDLIAWMAGEGEPPHPTFLLAVDVVLEDSETYGLEPRPRRVLPAEKLEK